MQTIQRFLVLVSFVTLAVFSQAHGSPQSNTQPAAGQGAAKTAEQEFKNIQSLKGVPAEELIPAMQYFNASLGVDCNFCHVVEPTRAFEKDDKEDKKAAREMIAMVRAINKDSFNGNLEVGCSTCHNGHVRPTPIAPVSEASPEGSRAPATQASSGQQPSTSSQQSAPSQPTPAPEQVLDAFQNAIGGRAAIQKITSIISKGTVKTAQGEVQVEYDRKAPNFYSVNFVFPGGRTSTDATNGTLGWHKAERDAVELSGYPLRGLLLASRFDRDLSPAANYSTTKVVGTDTINGHDVYIVRGTFKDPSYTERLYFDRQSGLLVRRTTFQRTLFGFLPDTSDFSDYRDVQGVKIPFTIQRLRPGQASTVKFESVQFNVPLDDSKFARPAGSPAANQK